MPSFLTWKKLFRTKLWTTLSILPFRSAWILKPDSLPSSYISFLNKHGGKDISIVKGFKDLALKIEPFTALKAIEEHYKSTGVDLQLDPQMSIPCKVMTTPLLHKQPIILYGNHLHLCTLWLEAVCVEDQFSHFCTFALGYFHMLHMIQSLRLFCWLGIYLNVVTSCRWYMETKDVCHIYSLSWDQHICGHCQFIYQFILFLHFWCIVKAFLQGNDIF